MKILPVAAQLFHAGGKTDRQTDRRDEDNSLLLHLLSVGLPVANAPDVLQPCGLLYYP